MLPLRARMSQYISAARYCINHPDVLKALQTVRSDSKGKEFPDMIDGENHQYVDVCRSCDGRRRCTRHRAYRGSQIPCNT